MRLEAEPAPVAGASRCCYPARGDRRTLSLVIASLLVLAAGASPFSVFYLVAKGAPARSSRCSKR